MRVVGGPPAIEPACGTEVKDSRAGSNQGRERMKSRRGAGKIEYSAPFASALTCDKLDRIGNPEAGGDTNGARDLESSVGLRAHAASRRRGRLLRLRILGEIGKSHRSQRLSGKLQEGRAGIRENPSCRVAERARSFDLDARAEAIRDAKPVFRLLASQRPRLAQGEDAGLLLRRDQSIERRGRPMRRRRVSTVPRAGDGDQRIEGQEMTGNLFRPLPTRQSRQRSPLDSQP